MAHLPSDQDTTLEVQYIDQNREVQTETDVQAISTSSPGTLKLRKFESGFGVVTERYDYRRIKNVKVEHNKE